MKIKINDNEGQYYSTSDLVKSSRDNKYQSYISPKIGDHLVYFNVNMNWINTKGHDFKKNDEMNNKMNKIKKINLTTPKLPSIVYNNENNYKINKLNMLQSEEDEKKEEINQMMQKIIDEI